MSQLLLACLPACLPALLPTHTHTHTQSWDCYRRRIQRRRSSFSYIIMALPKIENNAQNFLPMRFVSKCFLIVMTQTESVRPARKSHTRLVRPASGFTRLTTCTHSIPVCLLWVLFGPWFSQLFSSFLGNAKHVFPTQTPT